MTSLKYEEEEAGFEDDDNFFDVEESDKRKTKVLRLLAFIGFLLGHKTLWTVFYSFGNGLRNLLGVDFDFFNSEKLIQVIELFKKLENFYKTPRFDLIDFIGEILLSISDSYIDPKMELLMLTSIVELLLTLVPEKQYNAEESISKQFKLKTGVALNRKNNNLDLSHISKKMGMFYNLRSKIAHGDFKELQKILNNISNNQSNSSLQELVAEFRGYIRDILETYINEPEYMEALQSLEFYTKSVSFSYFVF